MISGNDDPGLKVERNEGQPPEYEGREGQTARIREGFYILTNKKSRSTLDLCEGDATPGAHLIGYESRIEWDNPNQLWLIKQEGLNDTYTLRSLMTGTFLDLLGGSHENGSQVVGWTRVLSDPHRLNQEWRIEQIEPDYYTLQCSRTGTFLEIPGGDPANCVDVKCSALSEEKGHQLWNLELVSRNSIEVRELFSLWKPDLIPRLFHLYGESSQYLVLRSNARRDIWEKTNLVRQPLCSHFFDYDDFVVRMKDAVTNWGRIRYPANIRGYSILFGIIYGEARKGPRAYNWYLSSDLHSLVFFDAQTGREYGPAALDGFGFEPTFAVF